MQFKKLSLLAITLLAVPTADAQRFLTDVMDTTTAIGKKLYPLYGKNDKIRFSGYLQPQFQYAESKGAKSFAGGDFAPNSDNRFTLRRGRFRIDYAHYNDKGQPSAFFVFQFDGTERGFFARDYWGRFYENKLGFFYLTTGMFARPMGYEVNLGSSDRESPERGRMSQTIMKVERDIGAMISFDTKKTILNPIKIDLGVFNGQGLNGPGEYDSHKDVIGRISLKPCVLGKNQWILSAGVSGYLGGVGSQSPWYYSVQGTGDNAIMKSDSSLSNLSYIAPRKYYGADAQLKIPNKKGYTEFRAEFIAGQQTGTANSSETPGTYPVSALNVPQPLYTRPFNGAYFYYLQHLGSDRLQLVLKYDWYDPNSAVKGKQITSAKGFSAADVRYDTYSGGINYYFNPHVKAIIYYDYVVNEKTDIKGYTEDLKDNVFTARLQFRF